ncbi:hypothetical protein HYV11_01565 [Candidatus Dependentiae bacterium]|nr:hypothetical protein [Candidatus Dependentiae bacterium]
MKKWLFIVNFVFLGVVVYATESLLPKFWKEEIHEFASYIHNLEKKIA